MELEIKLSPVTAAQASKVFGDPRISPFLGEAVRRDMESVYYGDGKGLLRQLGCALRLRSENGRPVACLKIRSGQSGMAEVRQEYEVEAKDIDDGVKKLLELEDMSPEGAAALRELDGLFPACGNSFTRTEAQYDQGGLSFILSYDIGEYFKGDLRAPLGELELELREGDPAALNALCRALCDSHGLTVCHVSKYQRAMELGEDENEKPQ